MVKIEIIQVLMTSALPSNQTLGQIPKAQIGESHKWSKINIGVGLNLHGKKPCSIQLALH